MGRSLDFDACEMSSSEVFSRHAAGRREMVALPVFPSRVFRHGFITVNRKAVKTPKDLEGKRIGVPLYTHDCGGVHPRPAAATNTASISRACIGSRAPPTARSRMASRRRRRRSSRCRSSRTRSGRSLSELLEADEIQAILGSGLPDALRTNPDVQRLFPDFHARRARLLQADANLPDHASRRHAPRRLRAASVHRLEPLSRR